ncbi:MAG: 6-carboxytetrahydropterin synthase [Gemmatimonadetes bacterium]|uniref:6-carboxy-5,6,7,8-tetrahydropterin synthase n=1 Tax=Candidatus Kutchimonas denitrificans TaxID=3056748 RepID=A0AAE4Z6Y8_9BACT|nr:6-carboxytetrahydropterin synthase [Gemmatimonadota bacterium]NIR74143.1 6-carboxytetrahydropterin synthase [Candidatus Kutchimonas denitrificans]NIS01325.1 6-carboxytetrahydropterin synthase [Gemmatimonadota bacterium]NIT67056.1 6-carboxytetrahydropterin synthase [Gemmatimonadota bacterium]NIU51716.1 6-carboxytetrahydropterin synthase [Gemmatimonadota bacterium]
MGYLTRAVHFSASHRYYRSDWSEEQNRQRFGLMADPQGHGHNYRCEVTVSGPIDSGTGMVIDLGELDRILEEEVVDRFHLRHINSAVPEFGAGGLLPTTENLAAFILDRIGDRLPSGVGVHRVRVREDRDLWSDVYGPEAG